eukprot:80171-Prymnesium_polylepis.1
MEWEAMGIAFGDGYERQGGPHLRFGSCSCSSPLRRKHGQRRHVTNNRAAQQEVRPSRSSLMSEQEELSGRSAVLRGSARRGAARRAARRAAGSDVYPYPPTLGAPRKDLPPDSEPPTPTLPPMCPRTVRMLADGRVPWRGGRPSDSC